MTDWRVIVKSLAALVSVLVCAAIAWLLVQMHLDPDTLLLWISGAVCLGWIVALVTVPWNLHFRARGVLLELQRVSTRGVRVEPARVDETVRIVKRTLWASIAAHAVSALVLVAVARLSGRVVWYYFAAFFLLSVALRPGFEYFRYLRGRLTTILADARYPFEDVATLITRVDAVTSNVQLCQNDLERMRDAIEALRKTTHDRDDEHDRRLVSVARRFEETLDRLSDNREIVSGLKAFLRMVRAEN